MNIKTKIRESVERLLGSPVQELGSWARFVRFQIKFSGFCARRLWENNVTAMSAALCFRTIFALVPAIVLAFLVLKSVGGLESGKRNLRHAFEASGITEISFIQKSKSATTAPGSIAQAEEPRTVNLANEIETLVERVESKLTIGRLGPVGVVLLIWTALTLLTAMERSLNRIFGAPTSRSLFRRIPMYWSVMTLGPVVLVAADYLGDRILGNVSRIPGLSWLLGTVGWAGPVLVGILVMSALYTLLPNTTVRFRPAVTGATVAVLLWLVAKWAFTLYVRKCVATGNLYGALGLLPLFLMWLNFSWLAFLFGAQIAHSAANVDKLQLPEQTDDFIPAATDLLATAIAVARPFLSDGGPVAFDEIVDQLRMPGGSVQKMLHKLQSLGLICPVVDTGATSYVLARSAARIPILDVIEMGEVQAMEVGMRYEAEIEAKILHLRKQAHSSLGSLTLADLFAHKVDTGVCL